MCIKLTQCTYISREVGTTFLKQYVLFSENYGYLADDEVLSVAKVCRPTINPSRDVLTKRTKDILHVSILRSINSSFTPFHLLMSVYMYHFYSCCGMYTAKRRGLMVVIFFNMLIDVRWISQSGSF